MAESLSGLLKKRDSVIAELGIVDVLDAERDEFAKKLFYLIPKGVNTYTTKHFQDRYELSEFLQGLHDRRDQEGGPFLDRLEDLEEYGFEDGIDALLKIASLKKAWFGIINVYVRTEGDHILVQYSIHGE